jgi:hypothetical protein
VKRGIGSSLGKELAAAASALASGCRQTALDELDAFVRDIETHIRSFPPVEGAALIEDARAIAAAI